MKYYLGIDLGGTNIVTGVVTEKYEIITKYTEKVGIDHSLESVTNQIIHAIDMVLEQADMTLEQLESVGMGSPSCMDPKTGLHVHLNCFDWHNVPLHKMLQERLLKPLLIRNDADCAAYGEVLAGAASHLQSAVMITLGTGVGGGVILDKHIFNGCDGMGAELGHTKLVFEGEMCTCGQQGCFEAYASATALINQTRQAAKAVPDSLLNTLCAGDLSQIEGRTAFDAAKQGDETAIAVIEQYIAYLAAGLSSLVTIFRPEAIIIGGGISRQEQILLKPLNEKLRQCTFAANEVGVPPVIKAKLGNDAGLIGAAMLDVDGEQ